MDSDNLNLQLFANVMSEDGEEALPAPNAYYYWELICPAVAQPSPAVPANPDRLQFLVVAIIHKSKKNLIYTNIFFSLYNFYNFTFNYNLKNGGLKNVGLVDF